MLYGEGKASAPVAAVAVVAAALVAAVAAAAVYDNSREPPILLLMIPRYEPREQGDTVVVIAAPEGCRRLHEEDYPRQSSAELGIFSDPPLLSAMELNSHSL